MGRKRKGGRWNQPPGRRRNTWVDIKKESSMFENYYKTLGIIPEEEWDDFMSAYRRELPSTFRITGTRSHANMLLHVLKHKFLDQLSDITLEGEKVEPPSTLPWYPDDLAWKINLSRKFIRKSPSIKKFHNFLVQETECGNISRQEAVSMIPPLLMDIKPGQKILDACAAPGSKTTQIIEMLHGENDMGLPEGLVIANELQNKRCYMLIHQSKRLRSPSCVITNHDAALYPTLLIKGENNTRVPLKFDRILCDVPCSGDGTLRKNPIIWNKWSPILGLSLHRIQMRILARSMEMLEVGGRIVYSTCTMAPVENESVVAEVLKNCQGALELVDLSNELPNLKRAPGLLTWKLLMKDGTEVTSCEPGSQAHHVGFKPSMFPPHEDEARKMHLDRCIRVYPHMQDTGGFFIAVLVKTKHAPWENGNRYNSEPRALPWEREEDVRAYMMKGKREGENSKSTDEKMATSTIAESSETTLNGAEKQDGKGTPEPMKTDSAAVDDVTDDVTNTPNDVTSDENAVVEGDVAEDNDVTGDVTNSSDVTGQDVDLVDDAGDDVTEGDMNVENTEFKDENENADAVQDSRSKSSQPPRKKQRVDLGFKEDPFILLPDDDPDWPVISDYYGFTSSFPSNQLLVRSIGGKKRNVYLVSKHVKQILECVGEREDVKIINTGVKSLSRCDAVDMGCEFRLMQEGIECLMPYVTKRKLYIPQEDVFTFLENDKPFTNKFTEATRKQLTSIPGLGCVMFLYDPSGEHSTPSDTLGCKLCFCGWKARTSVRVLMSRHDKNHYLSLFGRTPLAANANDNTQESIQEAVAEEPKAEEPKAEEPKAEEPKAEEQDKSTDAAVLTDLQKAE